MPKKTGIVLVVMGAVLMLSALLLFLYNTNEDRNAGQESEIILQNVQAIISQRVGAETGLTDASLPTEAEETTPEESMPSELTVVEIDGYGYIGCISIPALELELPVMSEWDYDRLKIAPCRHFGSPYTDDLVIAAHNYTNHFGRLSSLSKGDPVFFTDMNGYVNSYSVKKIETLDPTAVDAVQNSGFDLVLYTCTYGGATRAVVFCDRDQTAAGNAVG